jgi:hypothetical protein
MNSSTSYRTWIGFNDNSKGGITVYSVACYLSQGLQVDVFAFNNDAYPYLVDQAEGLTDEQRIELGQLAELSDRKAFWDLFNESVSPLTGYRIESHTLQLQPNLFKAWTISNQNAQRKLRAFASSPKSTQTLQPGDISPPGNDLKWSLSVNQFWSDTIRRNAIAKTLSASINIFAEAKEHHDKAEYFRRRAAAAESNVVIFSDDPDATEKLVDKIERLKKRQGVMKRANHLIRKADREGRRPWLLWGNNHQTFRARFRRQSWLSQLRPRE